jgi:hypothetical protein
MSEARGSRARDILATMDISQPTQFSRRLTEPETERPRESPPLPQTQKEDPFEREKDRRYKVNLIDCLKVRVATDPGEAATQSPHAVNYLIFDNYFDYLCSGRFAAYGVPQLDGQEQAMYYWFYRMSYGYGYSACPMSEAALMQRLDWVRKHVKRVLASLLQKGVIRKELEFPLFQHRRPQVYRVFLPREILQTSLKSFHDAQGRLPSDIPPDVRAWIREFTA